MWDNRRQFSHICTIDPHAKCLDFVRHGYPRQDEDDEAAAQSKAAAAAGAQMMAVSAGERAVLCCCASRPALEVP